jgi:hypothetical protein
MTTDIDEDTSDFEYMTPPRPLQPTSGGQVEVE